MSLRHNHKFGEQRPLNGSLPNVSCLAAAHDVITHANHCEDRLRRFGVAIGQIWAFFICFVDITTLSHYRTSV